LWWWISHGNLYEVCWEYEEIATKDHARALIARSRISLPSLTISSKSASSLNVPMISESQFDLSRVDFARKIANSLSTLARRTSMVSDMAHTSWNFLARFRSLELRVEARPESRTGAGIRWVVLQHIPTTYPLALAARPQARLNISWNSPIPHIPEVLNATYRTRPPRTISMDRLRKTSVEACNSCSVKRCS